jgi:hypothetical protein
MAVTQLPLFTQVEGGGVQNINKVVQYINQLYLFISAFMNTSANLFLAGAGATNVSTDDRVLIVKCGGVAATINLPLTPFVNETHTIKDGDGTGAGFITVQGGGLNIDGAASLPFTFNRQSVTVCYDGTLWQVIA